MFFSGGNKLANFISALVNGFLNEIKISEWQQLAFDDDFSLLIIKRLRENQLNYENLKMKKFC